jgi:RNA polymerase sigma-70 factor (ECF subfamily)
MDDKKDNLVLFRQIANGDKKAFDAFFKHYYPKLIQFACIYVGSVQQAEDIVSDVLVNMLIHRQRVFILEHFEAYLYASIKNRALSGIKKQEKINNRSQEPRNFKPIVPESANPHQLMVEQELYLLTQEIIRNFPPKRKMVFQLVREEELSYRKVAELMKISERTVEVHLKLAIKSLREGVEKYLGQRETKKTLLNLIKVSALLLFILSLA